jgi:hypothetical protein
MIDLIVIAVPVLVLALLYCGWRGARMLLGWRPATASVMNSDYDRLQQQDDFWSFGFTALTSRGWNWRDGEHGRLIEDQIVYDDADGAHHRATVQRRVRRGWRPWTVYTIWYDPADPDKPTAFGPGHWFGLSLVWAVALVGLIGAGMQLAGLDAKAPPGSPPKLNAPAR